VCGRFTGRVSQTTLFTGDKVTCSALLEITTYVSNQGRSDAVQDEFPIMKAEVHGQRSRGRQKKLTVDTVRIELNVDGKGKREREIRD